MTYFENFKNRTMLGATSSKEKITNEMERNFIKYLNTSPTASYFKRTIIEQVPVMDENNLPTDEIESELMAINDITENDDKALDEKTLLTMKDSQVDVGCYVFYDNSWFLVTFKESKEVNIYKKFIMRRCNQILNYEYHNKLYKIPLSIENLTMYSDGLNDGKYISFADAKRQMWYGSNPISRIINIGDRVMLTNKTTFRVTHINDFEYNGRYTGAYGLIKALVLQTTLVNEDDLENNAAWNKKASLDIQDKDKIFGEEIIQLGEKNTYSIDTNVDVEFKLDNPYEFATLTQNGNTCEIQVSSNFRYYGESIMILAINKDTQETINTKIIKIGG